MKYEHCPDCGTHMVFKRSSDNWASTYDCPKCGLNIHITHGEPHHLEPDEEKWTRPVFKPQ